MTLTFILLTLKLLCKLLVTSATSHQSLNVVQNSVFELTAGMRQTDGWTDGWTDTQTSVTWSPWEDLHTVTQINPKIKWIICCTKVYYINKFNKNFSHNLMSNSTRQIKQQTHQGKNIIFVVKVTSFQYQLLNYSVSFYCTSTQQC